MARAHYVENIVGSSGGGSLSLLDGATVHVYDQGTTTPIAQTIYAGNTGGTTLSNPLTSDANGKIEFWLDTAARVDLAVSKVGFTSQTRTVDVEEAPSGGGSGAALLSVTTTISSADLLALHTTGLQVIAAPGATKVVQLRTVALVPSMDGDAYTLNGAGLFLGAAPDPVAVFQAGMGLADTLGATPRAFVHSLVANPFAVFPVADWVNQAISAKLDAAITGGTATAILTVEYVLLDVPSA